MLTAIICEKNVNHLLNKVIQYESVVDAFEIRLDYLDTLDIDDLKSIRHKITKPIVLTLRSPLHQGHYQDSEAMRLQCLKNVASINPDYIDIEHDVNDKFIETFHQDHPEIKIIRSYHNFNETPQNLDIILQSMQHPSCSIYKVITTANSSLDSLRMLHFVKNNSSMIKLAGHCMGEPGIFSRILGPIVNSALIYASSSTTKTPAPGCIDLNTLLDVYSIKKIKPNTHVYALLGSPVEQSIGHQFHNKKFKEMGINAVYVKIKLIEAELLSFFDLIKGLSFKGFSITMPLKQAVIPHVDVMDKQAKNIGAINTVRFENGLLYACNTDASGALDTIESHQSIANKNMLIFGAGGAAKAIAYEAKLRGVEHITIVNRTLEKATMIANQLQGTAYDFASIQHAATKHYDISVNTIPLNTTSTQLIVTALHTFKLNNSLFMEINYNQHQKDLKQKLTAQGVRYIEGHQMFMNQAMKQLSYWFNHKSL